jgi:hypothetical protein
MLTIVNIVKRSWAIALLAVFSLALIAPAFYVSSDSPLPSCCARKGQHHCDAVNGVDAGAHSSGPAARDLLRRCPYYPTGGVVPVHSYAALRESSQSFFAALVSHTAVHAQTEARYRISFNCSRQKRGPPVLPC